MKKLLKKAAANVAAIGTTAKVATLETAKAVKDSVMESRPVRWGKNNKTSAVIISVLVIIIIIMAIIIALLLNRNLEPQAQESFSDETQEIIVEDTSEETETSDDVVDQKSTTKNAGTTPAMKDSHDWKGSNESYSVDASEEKVEDTNGKKDFGKDDIEKDPASKEAEDNIRDEVEKEKEDNELKDPEKHVVSDPNDKADVVGDDNTGKNDNVVKPEDPSLPAPFEEFEDLSSEESKGSTSETEPEVQDDTASENDVVPETEEKPSNDGVYNLFPSDDSSEDEDVTPEFDEEKNDNVVEDVIVSDDKNDNTDIESVLPETEEDKTDESLELPEDSFIEDFQEEAEPEIHVEDTTTSTPAEDEVKDVPAEFFSTYIKATGTVATLNLTAGKIASADAGEGVKCEIHDNVIVVELENFETTTVEVTMVDTLGNTITAIVAFEN